VSDGATVGDAPDAAADGPHALSPDTPQAVLGRALQRGVQGALGYAGAMPPRDAYLLWRAGAARIVDVRTQPEWQYVGRVPDVPLIEWRAHGSGSPNPGFIEELRACTDPGEVVLFLCRSGGRSDAAARLAAASGWSRAFNILEGFEGELDDSRRRGSRGGWRRAGLPWEQS
jgi:rhodanese-related sulfurtransferase